MQILLALKDYLWVKWMHEGYLKKSDIWSEMGLMEGILLLLGMNGLLGLK